MRVKEMLKITGGKLLSGDMNADIDLAKISTDSRAIKKGEFFIALSGPNFCGSDFTGEAFKKGAIGAITEKGIDPVICAGKIIIRVKTALEALRDIAASHRSRFGIPVICITGSNGKTTVKEMIASVLSVKYKVLKNEGTKNNNIGVPQTLLKLKREHKICVLELGTNQKGEIRDLTAIARPTAVVITNIGQSHLEHFIDLEGVYREKRQVLDSLGKSGFAVINGDDPILARIKTDSYKVIRYGLGRSNKFRASVISTSENGIRFTAGDGTGYSLKLLGAHNVYNALAAIAVGAQFRVTAKDAKRALSKLKPPLMRLNPLSIDGISIVNDSYNSNPSSMKSALEAMSACRAKSKWIVSGDMLELGKKALRLHRLTGKLIADSAATGLLTFGKLSKETLSGASAAGMAKERLWHCDSHDQIAGILKKVARRGDVVLVKGSRGMRMEKVIEKLRG